MEFQKVTDPDLLRQLNAPSNVPMPVTDQATLEQLNAKPTFIDRLGQTWPARMAKDIWSAAKLPGDVYSGETQVDPSNPEFMHRVTNLGGIAPVSVIPSVTAAAPATEQLLKTGGRQISEALATNEAVSPEAIRNGIAAIRKTLPNRRNAEETHAALDELENKVGPLTIGDIKQARNDLLDLQANAGKSTARTAATDLRASTAAKHGLDDIVRGTPAGDRMLEGIANVAGGKASEGLDKRQYRAELRTAVANSGQNLGNKIRSAVADMLLSRDARGMTPEQISAAENVAFGSNAENRMRSWGNTLGGGGGLGRTGTAAGMGVLGYLGSGGSPTVAGMSAIGFPLIGSILKHGANEAAVTHLDTLSNLLRSQTPLGETITRGTYVPRAADAKAALIRALMGESPYAPHY